MVLQTIFLGALANLIFRRRPKLGKLPGVKIRKGEAKKAAFRGDSGVINQEMYYDKGAIYFTRESKDLSRHDGLDFNDKNVYFKEDREDVKTLLDAIYFRDNKIFLRENYYSGIIDFDNYFGFNNSYPLDDDQAYFFTLRAISNGEKFTWESIEKELFGRGATAERKQYKQIVSPYGDTISHFAESLGREYDFRSAVIDAILQANTPKKAKQLLQDEYNYYIENNGFNYMEKDYIERNDPTELPFMF